MTLFYLVGTAVALDAAVVVVVNAVAVVVAGAIVVGAVVVAAVFVAFVAPLQVVFVIAPPLLAVSFSRPPVSWPVLDPAAAVVAVAVAAAAAAAAAVVFVEAF